MSTALVKLSDWMASQIEFWLPSALPDYDVSSFGRVRSYRTIVANTGPNSRGFRSATLSKPVVLNPSSDSSGYPYLNARPYGCPKVHRLAALAFLPNPDGLPEVNHRTGVKSDARVDNLEWITRQGNMQHANRTGIRDVLLEGEQNPNRKLDTSDVLAMRERAYLGESCFSIAKDYSINRCTVQDVVSRRTWKHI